jgi:hypothetical protein
MSTKQYKNILPLKTEEITKNVRNSNSNTVSISINCIYFFMCVIRGIQFFTLLYVVIVFSKNIFRVTKSRRIRRTEHVSHMGRNARKILARKPKEKVQLERPSRRREDNFEVNLKEVA